MSARYLGFVLVIWLPGALQAPSSSQSCDAPSLDGGYFLPEKNSYSHGSELSYACETGFKPAAEGWWAKSSCQNGKWVPEPQCVDEQACPLPEIPNVKSIEKQSLWYENGSSISITCDEGYEVKNSDSTVVCSDGKWSPEPVCDKSDQACDEPPKIEHAVVVGRGYQEVFADNSRVQYECEDGFTVLEGTESEKTITCRSGEWIGAPQCIRQDPGHGGSAGAGTYGGHATSAGRETTTTHGGRGTTAGTGNDGSTGRGHTTSTGSQTRPAGGGSSSTPDGSSRPAFIPVAECGNHPTIENGDVEYVDRMFLRYKCKNFYKLVGQENLLCNSDGSWSELPVCKEAFCTVARDQFYLNKDQYQPTIYLNEGVQDLGCIWPHYYRRRFSCINGVVTYTNCCDPYDISRGVCGVYRL